MHVKLYLLIAFYLTKNILVCLQALRYLRTSEIKPFIIFIKPPSSTCFLESRLKYNAMFTSEDGSATPCSVSYRPLLIYINIILFHSTISSLKSQNLHMYINFLFCRLVRRASYQLLLKKVPNLRTTLDTSLILLLLMTTYHVLRRSLSRQRVVYPKISSGCQLRGWNRRTEV